MIGTNLKSMVECPQDWHIVGADVDSQEQWIAAMLGDCCVGKGTAGATPFSNMLLAGRKTDNSDLHSVVAKEVGISRDKAKVCLLSNKFFSLFAVQFFSCNFI